LHGNPTLNADGQEVGAHDGRGLDVLDFVVGQVQRVQVGQVGEAERLKWEKWPIINRQSIYFPFPFPCLDTANVVVGQGHLFEEGRPLEHVGRDGVDAVVRQPEQQQRRCGESPGRHLPDGIGLQVQVLNGIPNLDKRSTIIDEMPCHPTLFHQLFNNC
jgi:hypothetical protein